jgi:hypothetical protein
LQTPRHYLVPGPVPTDGISSIIEKASFYQPPKFIAYSLTIWFYPGIFKTFDYTALVSPRSSVYTSPFVSPNLSPTWHYINARAVNFIGFDIQTYFSILPGGQGSSSNQMDLSILFFEDENSTWSNYVNFSFAP